MNNLKAVSVLVSVLSFPAVTARPVAVKSEFEQEAFRTASFQAARVFGRAGCGDLDLTEMVARNSMKTGLASNVLAAEIAIESSCNPLTVSRDGGVGLLQVMPKIWAGKYNNFRDKNLLKPEDSMQVGGEILAESIKTYGLRDGIRRYNGSGPDADSYAARVIQLAGAR